MSLRDITFQNNVGFPINRVEKIGYIQKLLEQEKTELPPEEKTETLATDRHNFRITDDAIGIGGAKEKFRNNMAAINLLHELEIENRLATPEEQEVLSRYVGWGGLSMAFDEHNAAWAEEFKELYASLSPEEYHAAMESTLTAFYTPPVVIKAMYDVLDRLGFSQGNILEPSCGTGNFFGLLPESMQNSKLHGVEIDSLTGRIAKQLYQKANIAIEGFEKTNLSDDHFDVVLGNVPFGEIRVNDSRYNAQKFLIHDYFFAKALDKVRAGGVVMFIKPTQDLHGMNAKYIYQNALQSSVFSHFADIDGNWNGLSVADVFGDKEIKVGYVNGWLSTSQNMAKIFIVLSLVIILLIAPVFSGEYGGVDNIILTSKYGKTKCATAKVLASLLSAVFITTLVVIFNLLIAVAIYGTEGLDCSILFAPIDFLEGYIPFNITCGTVLKYQILLAFMSAISVTGIVLILSAVCKSQMIAFVISAAIHVIPIMLPISETSALYRIIVLMPLFYSQYISIMSVEQMHNGMLYAVWSIPVAIALVVIGSIISHKAFSKHQVR